MNDRSDKDASRPRRRAAPNWPRRLTYGAVAVLALAVLMVLAGPHRFRYYTDGLSMRRQADAAAPRLVLWDWPEKLAGAVHEAAGCLEPTLSADGRTLVFARREDGSNADLAVSRLRRGAWTRPKPLENVNGPYDDRTPELSRDGEYLFFASNRPGGEGGYDIWLSRWDGAEWTEPVVLGKSVNTAHNERGPAFSAEGDRLYFSSDRPAPEPARAQGADRQPRAPPPGAEPNDDIFVAAAKVVVDVKPGETLAPVPRFWLAERVPSLNSPRQDRDVSVTTRGNVLYFSSDRDGGFGGFDLYRSQLIGGALTAPENVGAPVNTPANETDPVLAMEGLSLLFSSDREDGALLYASVSREVVGRSDLALLLELLGPLTILAVVLAAILYVLRILFDKELRRERNLLHKCLLASLLFHLLLAGVFSFWILTVKIQEALTERKMDIAVNVNALAKESLALALREQIAALPNVQEDKPRQHVQQVPIPDVRPMDRTMAPPTREVSLKSYALEVEAMLHEEEIHDQVPPAENRVELAKPDPLTPRIRMEIPRHAAQKGTEKQIPLVSRVPEKTPPKEEKKTEKQMVRKQKLDVPAPQTPLPAAPGGPLLAQAGPEVASTNVAPDVTVEGRFFSPQGDFPVSESQYTAAVGPGHKEFGTSTGTLLLPAGITMESEPMRPRQPAAAQADAPDAIRGIAVRAALHVGHGRSLHTTPKIASRAVPLGRATAPPGQVQVTPGIPGLGGVGHMVADHIPNLDLPAAQTLEVPPNFKQAARER
ncbi:MAG: PD40 domain-containing protein [Kiritimatiellae bacterium]|nr:PD40 domain-containing protein [Kiritimatiellia bacterium]